MDKGNRKFPAPKSQRSGRLANGGEPTDATPDKLVPVEEQEALRVAPAETGHVAVAIRAAPDRAEGDDRKLPLQFRLVSAESQKLRQSGRTETALVQLGQNGIGGHPLVELEEHDFGLARSAPTDREMLSHDVVVFPVVATDINHVGERHAVVNDDVVATTDHAIRHDQFGNLAAQSLVGLDPTDVIIGTAEVFDLLNQGN